MRDILIILLLVLFAFFYAPVIRVVECADEHGIVWCLDRETHETLKQEQ